MTRGDESLTTTYVVSGMTCGHCVAAVTEEISAIHGVEGVTVELVVDGGSLVSVTSAGPMELDDVRAAVDEAGYALVP